MCLFEIKAQHSTAQLPVQGLARYHNSNNSNRSSFLLETVHDPVRHSMFCADVAVACCWVSPILCCRWIDAGKFLTGFSAVGSIAIPAILAHAKVGNRATSILAMGLAACSSSCCGCSRGMSSVGCVVGWGSSRDSTASGQ